jgi:hypothetical protein
MFKSKARQGAKKISVVMFPVTGALIRQTIAAD